MLIHATGVRAWFFRSVGPDVYDREWVVWTLAWGFAVAGALFVIYMVVSTIVHFM